MSTVVASNLQASGGGGTAATLASINGGPISGARNRIINGDMRIDQRNAGAATVVTNANINSYQIDRWITNGSISAGFNVTVQQNQGSITPPAGFTNYLGVLNNAAYTIGSAEAAAIQQRIEGFNFADLGWGAAGAQAVTLSFWVRSSLTGTFGGTIRNDGNTRSYVFSYSISSANTWEYKTITVPGDTTGTWLTNNGTGVRVLFALGTGTTTSGTAGSWSANNFSGVTGGVSVLGTLNATWNITGVQLEQGSTSTPFERRSYGQELALCQRYYQTHQYQTGGVTSSGVGMYGQIFYNTEMRSAPTAVFSSVGAVGNFDTAVPAVASVSSAREISFFKTATATGSGIYSFSGTFSSEL